MAIFKIEKNKNYTVMSNYHLRDKNLSYKAKGLLSFMLSLPEDWDYSLAGLFEYNYLICEVPHKLEVEKKQNHPYLVCPYLDNPYLDKPDMETPTQINTNKQNTKKQIDKIDKGANAPFFDADMHNKLTVQLINKKYIDDNDTQISYYDNLFNKLLIDNSYKEIITIINYIVPRVLSRGFKDENGKYITNKFGYLKNAIYSDIEKINSYSDINLWDYNDYIEDSDNVYDLKDYDNFER